MKVFFNGREVYIDNGISLERFLAKHFPRYHIAILNTVINPDGGTILKNNDRITAFEKGKFPDNSSLEELMFSRQPALFTEKLSRASVGIAGLGGLGSVVGENLIRAGIGKLVVLDYDIVEPPNLNRQRYFINQIGMPKTEAFKQNAEKISPFTEIEAFNVKYEKGGADIFKQCDVIAECFDNPEYKALLVSEVRDKFPDKVVVASSGVAGFDSEKTITAKKISDKIYVVGDGVSEVKDGLGLVATRVGVAASIQSHLILRIILGLEK